MTTASKITLSRVLMIPVYLVTMYLSGGESNVWMFVSLAIFIAAMCVFCEWGVFPAWTLMIVLTREFGVTGLRLIAVQKGTVIAAGWSGKVKTASTMVGLCLMMALPGIPMLSFVVIGVIVVTTVYSGAEYFIQNWKCLWD